MLAALRFDVDESPPLAMSKLHEDVGLVGEDRIEPSAKDRVVGGIGGWAQDRGQDLAARSVVIQSVRM